MTDVEKAAVPAEPSMDAPAIGRSDDSMAAIRRQRDVALQAGDRATAEEFDSLERELYEAEAADDRPEAASPDAVEAASFTESDHAPLNHDEAAGVFAFLDEVDPEAAVSLRAEWGGDAAANLGYAHLWFTTQYTQNERDSMVVTPGLVRMAARMGRKLAASRRKAETDRPDGGRDTAEHGVTSHREQVNELRRRRGEALRTGNYRRAQELDEQERAAWAQLHGGGPIVGRAGRIL